MLRTLQSVSRKVDSLGVESRGIERCLPDERSTSKWVLLSIAGLWNSGCGGLTSMSSFFLGPLLFELGYKDSTTVSGSLPVWPCRDQGGVSDLGDRTWRMDSHELCDRRPDPALNEQRHGPHRDRDPYYQPGQRCGVHFRDPAGAQAGDGRRRRGDHHGHPHVPNDPPGHHAVPRKCLCWRRAHGDRQPALFFHAVLLCDGHLGRPRV
ncbi:hypothetical protein KL944_004084 [Ogataea haglerorum]|nr:hypothetical protein KL944_004084 [Ogataea haglerorum]